MNAYPVNELVRLSVTFTELPDGAVVDPSAVSLTITPPDQGEVIVIDTPSRDDVGKYHYDFVISHGGLWIYRWQGTGAVIASSGNGFLRGV